MIEKDEFNSLVETSNMLLKSVAQVANNLNTLNLEDSGPLDANAASAMRDHLPHLRDGIAKMITVRNQLAAVWLRTGESRAELSRLTGIPVHQLRLMAEAANAEMDVD